MYETLLNSGRKYLPQLLIARGFLLSTKSLTATARVTSHLVCWGRDSVSIRGPDPYQLTLLHFCTQKFCSTYLFSPFFKWAFFSSFGSAVHFFENFRCKTFCELVTLLGTNISPEKSVLKMIFLFPRVAAFLRGLYDPSIEGLSNNNFLGSNSNQPVLLGVLGM